MNLNPFIIREADAEEVFKIIKRRSYYIRHKDKSSKPKEQRRRIDPRNASWLS